MFKSIILISVLSPLFFVNCSNGQNGVESKSMEEALSGVSGEHKEYYENGQLKIAGEYLYGKKNGTWISFFPNGLKQSETSFNGDILHGKTATFHENGHLYYLGYFRNGKKDGQWMFHDTEGNYIKEVIYSNDEVVKSTDFTIDTLSGE